MPVLTDRVPVPSCDRRYVLRAAGGCVGFSNCGTMDAAYEVGTVLLLRSSIHNGCCTGYATALATALSSTR
jgi:hypothetical protein